jgi:catechol 2,3-dioxygenase-like lactoylglutathione lyase family enzyme
MAIEIHDLNHITLIVQDVEASLRFYCGVLGMYEIPRNPSMTFPGAWVRGGTAEIHLIQADWASHGPGDPSFAVANTIDFDLSRSRHFSLVIPDTEALLQHMHAHGVAIAYGPVERAGGLVQTLCYDPDGHLVEFTQLP